MKKVGIMGGTFNPIHMAHLLLAENAFEQFQLDEVVFMPSKRPAHKDLSNVIEQEHRQKMIELAIAGNPHFRMDTMEFDREGNTYTADTLLELKKMNPEVEYFFIIGGDSLFQLEQWSRPELVMSLSHIVAAQREDMDDKEILVKIEDLRKRYDAQIDLLKIPQIDISSKMLRDKLQQGKTIRYYVPLAVEQYIIENDLYKC